MDLNQLQLLNRFGLGPSHADVAAIAGDPYRWLEKQIDERTASVRSEPSYKLLARQQDVVMNRQAARRAAEGSEEKIARIEEEQKKYRRQIRAVVGTQAGERFRRAVATLTPFSERLVHFYSNHFTVSARGKPQLLGSCQAFENEAIRPFVSTRFEDMLLSVVSHPVMLIYLDNAQSVGPKSRLGRRGNRGLNENLAREILELHTLGVDGGYAQKDVVALAKMLTGWTVGNKRRPRTGEPGKFSYLEFLHEPGAQRLLGKRYANNGMEQARTALQDLANHPATARHLATKLARHFVADEPPQEVIDRLEKVYIASGGHLPTVHRTLLQVELAGTQKFKTPFEYLVSLYRGFELPTGSRGLRMATRGLRTMNHWPFTAASPAGWADKADAWAAPNMLKQRIDWAVAAGAYAGGRPATEVDAAMDLMIPANAAGTRRSVGRAASSSQAVAIMMASPEVQWR